MTTPRWDPKAVARGCQFKGVVVGRGRALHLVAPVGGPTLCGRRAFRVVAPPRYDPGWEHGPLCRTCLRELDARVFVDLGTGINPRPREASWYGDGSPEGDWMVWADGRRGEADEASSNALATADDLEGGFSHLDHAEESAARWRAQAGRELRIYRVLDGILRALDREEKEDAERAWARDNLT